MKKDNLFEYIETLDKEKLIELLESAYDEMDTDQRHDEEDFIKSYLTSLSAISTPEEYAKKALPLIRRDAIDSFCNKVYSTATKLANEPQKTLLKKEVKKQGVKTKGR